MAIDFKRLNATDFREFLEMATKFGAGDEKKKRARIEAEPSPDTEGQRDELYDDISKSVWDSGIMSSSAVEYDNQAAKWQKVAKSLGFADVKEMAEWLSAYVGDKNIPNYELFPGVEGLAGAAKDAGFDGLIQHTDYGSQDFSYVDQMAVSFFYGGKRAKQWLKYAKQFMTPRLMAIQLSNLPETGFVTSAKIDPNADGEGLVLIEFDESSMKEDKAIIEKIFANSDPVFDYEIDEPEESDTWSIKITRK